MIIKKNAPLYDTLIDGNLLTMKYARILNKEIKDAGFDSMHGVFLEIDDYFQDRIERKTREVRDKILDSFNSIFGTNYTYIVNDNGIINILFGKFHDYQEFVNSYFGIFLLKMFAFEINTKLSEGKDDRINGLSDFIARFVPDYFKTYQEITMKMKFINVIDSC